MLVFFAVNILQHVVGFHEKEITTLDIIHYKVEIYLIRKFAQ
jgi:hypothetical protein